ncbi:MAG: radical SAM protein [Candidatus Aminicenantes bacterium]|nr:radical SAM protein [Candidatus Aminicenantes bacterium]
MSNSPYEVGPIRPPSEANSLLIRVSRNCPWNKCEFCPIYKRHPFEKRPVEDILKDIDAAAKTHGDVFRTAFLQDANSLLLKTPDLLTVIVHLKQRFPAVERVTSYARARTVARKTVDELKELQKAGLSRLHIGLETGYNALLVYMKKGMTADMAVDAGLRIKHSGISLCFYVIIGLGGQLRLENKETWREHAVETARVLNQVDPDYIRVRTLTIREGSPLFEKTQEGEFAKAGDASLVREELLMIEHLKVTSQFVSDHSTNILMDIRGKFPEDKERLITIAKRYLALSEDEQLNFRLGTVFRFFGYSPNYRNFEDFYNLEKRAEMQTLMDKMEAEEPGSSSNLLLHLSNMLV